LEYPKTAENTESVTRVVRAMESPTPHPEKSAPENQANKDRATKSTSVITKAWRTSTAFPEAKKITVKEDSIVAAESVAMMIKILLRGAFRKKQLNVKEETTKKEIEVRKQARKCFKTQERMSS